MITLRSAGISAGLLTGATGLTCGVGYSTGLFNSKELSNPNTQISKLLDREGKYVLLSIETGDDAGWNETWKQYKEDNKSQDDGQDSWKVDGWTKADVADVPAGFKTKCSKKKDIEIPSIESQEYTDFIKYCTRPKTVQEILRQKGFSPLKDDNNTKWKERVSRYKDSNNQLPKAKIESSESSPNFETLKNGCEAALSLKTTEEGYNETLAPTKEWCGTQ
ncbi:hypothetical protein A6V39_00470 [Candidatus Mycoplasma haematobovis]|uniref:Uncharacterized protein n=1 Tax=Candidatus Mycoplasma haematobovis TaxID=432608 RepID=A0A1A9QEG6_9MOLU|nr:hypothetical protein [Candidatus Mycoplasma haematobovis]OAL10524.1 hypothetical protein A6V39_00470 [Candidatus Mycoplasma haematobovis]